MTDSYFLKNGEADVFRVSLSRRAGYFECVLSHTDTEGLVKFVFDAERPKRKFAIRFDNAQDFIDDIPCDAVQMPPAIFEDRKVLEIYERSKKSLGGRITAT